MKRVMLMAGVVMCLMIFVFSAQAALVQSDVFDPADNWGYWGNKGTKIKPSCDDYPELDFDLALQEYTPGTPLTSAELKLDMADNRYYPTTAGGDVTLLLEGGNKVKQFIVDGARKTYRIDISDTDILTELATNGSLELILGVNTNGIENGCVDYIFYNARMYAQTVPIPSAVLLLGTGLVGLVGIRRRSKNQ